MSRCDTVGALVMSRAFSPSRSAIQIAHRSSPPVSRRNAICCPSGDQRGETLRSVPSVS
jgi:hypothetical protein